MSIRDVCFVDIHGRNLLLVHYKDDWSVLELYDVGGREDIVRVGEWRPRGTIIKCLAVNSDSSSPATLAIGVLLQPENHGVQLLSISPSMTFEPMIFLTTILNPIALQGDLIGLGDFSLQSVLWNWREGTSATLHEGMAPQRQGHTTRSGEALELDLDGLNFNPIYNMYLSQDYVFVARAYTLALFAMPKRFHANPLTAMEDASGFIAMHSFGCVDALRMTPVPSKEGGLPSYKILVRAFSDDAWRDRDSHTLEVFTLEPNDPSSSDIPYRFPPKLDARIPTKYGRLNCTNVYLGKAGVALWTQPKQRMWRPFGDEDAEREYIYAAILPDSAYRSGDGVARGSMEQRSDGSVKLHPILIQTNEDSECDWTDMDWDEATGRIALGSQDGSVALIEILPEFQLWAYEWSASVLLPRLGLRERTLKWRNHAMTRVQGNQSHFYLTHDPHSDTSSVQGSVPRASKRPGPHQSVREPAREQDAVHRVRIVSENVTKPLGGITSQGQIERSPMLVLSPLDIHEGPSSLDRISELYGLHDILHLGYATPSSPSRSPQRHNLMELAGADDLDNGLWLHREPHYRRGSPESVGEGSPRHDQWQLSYCGSYSDSEWESGSEINVVSFDTSGRVSRISTIPIDIPGSARSDFVPLPPDLRGRLQKLEKRAGVEVLHDVRPKRQLTEREEFMAWMNKDGVRMLLTPASQAILKSWLAEGDSVIPEPPSILDPVLSPPPFRVCVEEDSDIEDKKKVSLGGGFGRPGTVYLALHSNLRDADDDEAGDEDSDAGNDADVEDHGARRRRRPLANSQQGGRAQGVTGTRR
ncbi:hypothetical protein NMY22_g3048 [Coprinellus aureogranulatus]|nr:hypothetical protein NMY22_g3048 [Coprinellus aureogranulatus]